MSDDIVDPEIDAAAAEAARLEAERLAAEQAARAAAEALMRADQEAAELAAGQWLIGHQYVNGSFVVSVLPAIPEPMTLNGYTPMYNPTMAQRAQWYREQGWRIATEGDIVQAQILHAQHLAEDYTANAKYYSLQNAYLLLCLQVTGVRQKLGGEQQAMIVRSAQIANQAQGDSLNQAFVFLTLALGYYDQKWWDVVEYRDVPELVQGAVDILALKAS